jgi:ParB family chromosome partitioning protein
MEVWKELGAITEETGIRALKEARLIDIALIRPNPLQPRKTSDQQALEELAESIREQGLLQPIVVRPEGDEFIIIAGHRRFEACKLIGMDLIPSVVREATEHEALEQSLIENVQREDINPVEEAQCYRRLMDEHSYSIRDMAAKVHKSVGYIHSRLELLKHEDLAQSVRQARVGVFEARELAKVEDNKARQALTERVVAGELDRQALTREVKVLTGKAQQLPLFDARSFSRRWGRLRKDLEALDAAKLAAEEREKARLLLEEIKQTVEETLARITDPATNQHSQTPDLS